MCCTFISSKYCAKSCFSKTLHETAGEDNPEKTIRFIDGGTTNLVAAGVIPERLSTTVATQYPAITAALATRQDITLIMIGGQVRPRLGAAVGVEATGNCGKAR